MQQIFDHTESNWSDRYNRHDRENGAATYSRDLVKYQVQLWDHESMVLSTCPLLSQIDDVPEAELFVQYLHTYAYEQPLHAVREIINATRLKCRRIVFVTAYNSFHLTMQRAGIESVFIPMTIDAEAVRSKKAPHDTQPKAVIYFGNVMPAKERAFREIRAEFRKYGWRFDVLSHNRLNGEPIGDQDVHEIVQNYDYGIGVGRCALEMMALGLKVMISGIEFGGLMVNEHDFQVQTMTNMNGRITTFDRQISRCIDCFDDAIVRTNDIQELIPDIEKSINPLLIK